MSEYGICTLLTTTVGSSCRNGPVNQQIGLYEERSTNLNDTPAFSRPLHPHSPSPYQISPTVRAFVGVSYDTRATFGEGPRELVDQRFSRQLSTGSFSTVYKTLGRVGVGSLRGYFAPSLEVKPKRPKSS